MSFCEHCEGQRFDRARVLRAIRQVQRQARDAACGGEVEAALVRALDAVRVLDVPHLGPVDEEEEEELIIH